MLRSRFDQSSLIRLLEDSTGYLSGEELSKRLGVSRTAVWKQVAALRRAGYSVDAVPSRGYRIVGVPDKFDTDSLKAGLSRDAIIGRKIVCLKEAGSTNTEAFRMAEAGAPEGTVVIAESQAAGKGRLGRQWISPSGVNLYMSVILRPMLPPYEAPQLTFLSAVAVARAINIETGLKPAIKWPNDLLLDGSKVAGLLNEMNSETDRIGFLILGIGLNINMKMSQFPEDLRSPATSLAIALGHDLSRNQLTVRLLKVLDGLYTEFGKSGFGPIRQEWSDLCNAYGRQVSVEYGGSVLTGDFGGIDHDGAMLVLMQDGHTERILAGDVTVL